jgi:hypothetical protein
MVEYKILKLRSGEELISIVNQVGSKKVVLDRPMQMKLATMHDPITGEVKKEMWVLRDWMNNSEEITCDIPLDFVVTTIKPNQKIIDQYESKKLKEDEITSLGIDPIDPNSILEDLYKQLGIDISPENLKDKTKPPTNEEEMIMMNFAMSKKMFEKMMEEGFFDEVGMGLDDEIPLDDFDFDEEEKTDRSKEEPDWGNDWSDWSGDAEDYTN